MISHETVYGPSRTVLEHHYTRFGVEVTFVDTSNTSAVAAAIRHNTVLIYLEVHQQSTFAYYKSAQTSATTSTRIILGT